MAILKLDSINDINNFTENIDNYIDYKIQLTENSIIFILYQDFIDEIKNKLPYCYRKNKIVSIYNLEVITDGKKNK